MFKLLYIARVNMYFPSFVPFDSPNSGPITDLDRLFPRLPYIDCKCSANRIDSRLSEVALIFNGNTVAVLYASALPTPCVSDGRLYLSTVGNGAQSFVFFTSLEVESLCDGDTKNTEQQGPKKTQRRDSFERKTEEEVFPKF